MTVLSGGRLMGLAMCLSATLAGCGGLFHSNARPEQVYVLRSAPIPQDAVPRDSLASRSVTEAPVGASLRVNRPTANPGLDSPQIILVQSDRRMSFFTASRWAAPASNMLEMLAVEKLRASGTWVSVADSSSAFPSDYVLQTTIRRFEADYSGGEQAPPEVHVVIDCLVGKREGREVVANFLAIGTAQANANRMSAVVPAFEAATNAALDSMAAKTAEAVRNSVAHKVAGAP